MSDGLGLSPRVFALWVGDTLAHREGHPNLGSEAVASVDLEALAE
jgi:hypothetical protein